MYIFSISLQLNARFVPKSLLIESRQHLETYTSRTIDILQSFKHCKNTELLDYLIKLVKTLNFINEK